MSKQIIQIENESQWLAERLKDVTSTEVSALYGLSPYMSEFELFHHKRDAVVVKIEPNERMKWGTRLESAIAYGAAEDMGWTIEKFNVYMRDSELRMGSSFDFKIVAGADSVGILEVKNVDGLQYSRTWVDDGSGNILAPDHIELQIQHQMEVSDIDWTALVVLVGGNEQKIVFRKRDRVIGKDISERVAAFWKMINDNRPPKPDYTVDAEFIIKSLRNQADESMIIDVSNSPEIEDMIKQYDFISREANALDKLKTQRKAEILDKIGTASKVLTSFGSLSCGSVKGKSGTLVTPEMVGTYIGTSEGYRNFRFYPRKEK